MSKISIKFASKLKLETMEEAGKTNKKVAKEDVMYSGLKLRLYPTSEQAILLSKHFGCCRLAYNKFVAQRSNGYSVGKQKISKTEMQTLMKDLKNGQYTPHGKSYDFLSEVNSQSIQIALGDAENAYTRFFNGIGGYPKFKKKADRHDSFSVPQRFSIEGNKLFIPKLKEGLRFDWSRNKHKISEDMIIKCLTISRNPSGHYFVSFRLQQKVSSFKQYQRTGNMIGLDLGLNSLFVDSKGNKLKGIKSLKKFSGKLRKQQKALSRKQTAHKNKIGKFTKNETILEGFLSVEMKTVARHKNLNLTNISISPEVKNWKKSNRYEKNRLKLAKTHNKVANIRRDFSHKATTKLVKENDILVIEDLATANMIKNHKLAKSFADAGLGEFIRQLQYKSEWHGRLLIKVGRFFPSSKTCSCCGHINNDLKLKHREWTCPSCGMKHDRDENAAINMRLEGVRLLTESHPLLLEEYLKEYPSSNAKIEKLGINDMELFVIWLCDYIKEPKRLRSVKDNLQHNN